VTSPIAVELIHCDAAHLQRRCPPNTTHRTRRADAYPRRRRVTAALHRMLQQHEPVHCVHSTGVSSPAAGALSHPSGSRRGRAPCTPLRCRPRRAGNGRLRSGDAKWPRSAIFGSRSQPRPSASTARGRRERHPTAGCRNGGALTW
jgi:hypothetical protein